MLHIREVCPAAAGTVQEAVLARAANPERSRHVRCVVSYQMQTLRSHVM